MSDLPEVYRVLGQCLDASSSPPDVVTLDEVRAFVRHHVARLLDENPGLLMSILYRVDVSESQVQAVMRNAGPAEIPDQLSDLLIERQLGKLHLRRKYSRTTDQ